ncbi:cupin domain-containing protein [Mucilaginibacter sp.]
MIDIQAYIDSGTLEQYCLDLFNTGLEQEVMALRAAYPEIAKELNAIELALENFAESQAVEPKPQLRDKIFATLNFPGEVIDLENLPLTSKYSNYQSWLAAVEHLIPSGPFEDFFAELLQQNDKIAQTLVITKLNVPEELHEVVEESFFILKGTCTCTVGKEIFTLNAGDYLNIPLFTNHDIRIDSPYVIAILQHKFS